MRKLSFFSGRRLLLSEVPLELRETLTHPKIREYPTMVYQGESVQCLRCGSWHRQKKVIIVNPYEQFHFCPTCIQLGRVQSNLVFYGSRWRPRPQGESPLGWQGQLTNRQRVVSDQLAEVVADRQTLLVHAVTGAGKTEMVFKGVHEALCKGWRVGIASPRVDVCLELYPRLQHAFPEMAISLLHGQQEEAYGYSSLVICTTHQLLRFYHAFDLLIVDEVDAFPFVNNLMLGWAVANSKKKKAAHIMLSATPTDKLNRLVEQGGLEKLVLPARFHGHKLPEPKVIWDTHWDKLTVKGQISATLSRLLQKQVQTKRRTLVFCATISKIETLGKHLKSTFPQWRIGLAHAKDNQRHIKVKTMRQAGYDLFLTTTIMERGVTFADIDVLVLGSNHEVFNRATLVQIAGRAGRSQSAPDGRVYFFHDGWTKAMKGAIKEIRQLNCLAEREGLITK